MTRKTCKVGNALSIMMGTSLVEHGNVSVLSPLAFKGLS